MVVFTPKSMLRNKAAVSKVEDFHRRAFQSVIDDPTQPGPNGVRKILFVSGKLYYELAAEQEKRGATDTAVVRVEQLYPVPEKKLRAIFVQVPERPRRAWVQEEPAQPGLVAVLRLVRPREVPRSGWAPSQARLPQADVRTVRGPRPRSTWSSSAG